MLFLDSIYHSSNRSYFREFGTLLVFYKRPIYRLFEMIHL